MPYRAGPSLRVTSAGIEVGGKRVAPADVGQWRRLRMTAPLGKPGSTWTLEVRSPSRSVVKLTGLAPVSSAWRTLNYVGYIPNAGGASSFCLADLKITNSKQLD